MFLPPIFEENGCQAEKLKDERYNFYITRRLSVLFPLLDRFDSKKGEVMCTIRPRTACTCGVV